MSRNRTLLLPLILLAFWPEPVQETTIVVAACDLGAGAVLTEADLTARTLPADQAPPDAVTDPAALMGQTLAVARSQGEAVTRCYLGATAEGALFAKAVIENLRVLYVSPEFQAR